MKNKGKLIGIYIESKDKLDKEKIKILEEIEVVFAHNIKNEKNKALDEITPILEKRKDYKKLMLVKPVFPSKASEKSLKNSWDMAAAIIDSYLNSGRNVAFLCSESIEKSDFKFVKERLKDKFEIEIFN